jgi:hypothetical protein
VFTTGVYEGKDIFCVVPEVPEVPDEMALLNGTKTLTLIVQGDYHQYPLVDKIVSCAQDAKLPIKFAGRPSQTTPVRIVGNPIPNYHNDAFAQTLIMRNVSGATEAPGSAWLLYAGVEVSSKDVMDKIMSNIDQLADYHNNGTWPSWFPVSAAKKVTTRAAYLGVRPKRIPIYVEGDIVDRDRVKMLSLYLPYLRHCFKKYLDSSLSSESILADIYMVSLADAILRNDFVPLYNAMLSTTLLRDAKI